MQPQKSQEQYHDFYYTQKIPKSVMVHHETGVPAQVLETELNTICKIN